MAESGENGVADESGADESGADEFLEQLETTQPGLLFEFWDFLQHNKKWWLLPLLLAILLLGSLVILSGTGLGSFIYPML